MATFAINLSFKRLFVKSCFFKSHVLKKKKHAIPGDLGKKNVLVLNKTYCNFTDQLDFDYNWERKQEKSPGPRSWST